MKRARSKKAEADQSVSPPRRRPRRRVEKNASADGAEERPRPGEANDTAEQRPSYGFAYLRDAGENASPHLQTLAAATEAALPAPLSLVKAAGPKPGPGDSDDDDDDDEGEVSSPLRAQSATRGFSHLRESIFFALPRLRGSVGGASIPRGGSVVLPLSTPLPASAPRSSVSSSHSLRGSRGNNQQLQQLQQQQQKQQRRHYQSHKSNGSEQSFLSTRSAVEYLNSTGSLGEVISSRESRRSSQATGSRQSYSKSTLGPLDLSPILKEEKRRRRRRDPAAVSASGGGSATFRQPRNGLPIEVPAAVMNPATAGARNSRSMTLEGLHHSLARYSRATTFFLVTCFFVAVWGVMAAPLLMRQNSPEEAFVRHYVDSVSELQFIYEVPYMSLSANEARRLYLRVLSETLERLERSTFHMSPNTNVKAQILYYKQMIRAYAAVRHRVRLYARSRERSRLNQFVINPLRDAWQYGILRHGLTKTIYEVILEPSFLRLWARVKDIAVCLRQDEKMPCPTLAYLQEEEQQQPEGRKEEEEEEEIPPAMLPEDALKDSNSSYEGGEAVEELRRLKKTLKYVRESCRQSNREYNHLHTRSGTEPVLS
ncbi:uncharacterized protein Tco025E_01068 [Trypanosoma conorhini]|uniref:Transmembrane protein n=1 Tax=Trypanosoma conorhini TaxID=83891 RepID=A0A422Q9M7_9TRYP|nr:uncharacterized protein Tco025E_01068 [Trypanosoma conorhini]RNF26670.1 hypothetical protein Tco025E_01068 [Trypanosoma conorhini]